MFAAKPTDLSLVSRTHMLEEMNPASCPLISHMYVHVHSNTFFKKGIKERHPQSFSLDRNYLLKANIVFMGLFARSYTTADKNHWVL